MTENPSEIPELVPGQAVAGEFLAPPEPVDLSILSIANGRVLLRRTNGGPEFRVNVDPDVVINGGQVGRLLIHGLMNPSESGQSS